jgi:RimJ/RimL family protein N-acetyltransferase
MSVNVRCRALYRGFVEEGRHRKIVWLKGSWRDTFYMGILEDEWSARRKMKGATTPQAL